jgi:hypothetical protein
MPEVSSDEQQAMVAGPGDEAADHGIKRVAVEQFEFGGYRYSNLKDAVAEARRSAAKATP